MNIEHRTSNVQHRMKTPTGLDVGYSRLNVEPSFCILFDSLTLRPFDFRLIYPKYSRPKKIPEPLKGSGIPFFILFRHISPSAGRRLSSFYSRQVFWLPDHPTCRAFPILESVAITVFVPDHSGGPATDFHRFPYYSPMGYPPFQGEYRAIICWCQYKK